MRLSEKLKELDNEIENILKEHDFSLVTDKNVNVIMGDKARGTKNRPPILACFIDGAQIDNAGSSLAEVWSCTVVVVSLVRERDPRKGKDLATDLATEASDALIKNRSLNGTVSDIRRTRFSPGDDRSEVGEDTFGAGIEMEARFRFRT